MAEQIKVAFIDTVHPYLEEKLTEKGMTCLDMTQQTFDELQNLLKDVQGIVIRSRFRLDEKILKHAEKLKFIARSGAGMENIDVAYCEKRGIDLFNAPEGNKNAVAEHALGMLLSLFNNLNKADQEIRKGIWEREANRGIELEGKTVGIIGFGNNGSQFAKILRGFEVKILAYDKYKSGFGNDFVQECNIDDIFSEADIVSFHIPQNEESLYMCNEEFINRFKHPFYLINLSRGKIVDTSALTRAIQSGKIKGACLDVLEYEKSSFEDFFSQKENLPVPFQYLLNSDKVILSPHVGGWTHESYFKLSKVLADKIIEKYGYK